MLSFILTFIKTVINLGDVCDFVVCDVWFAVGFGCSNVLRTCLSCCVELGVYGYDFVFTYF